MKITLLAMSAVAALAAAMPAAAQYQGRYSNQYSQNQYGQDVSFEARIDALQARLDAGLRQGTIDRREAWTLRRQLGELQRLEDRYSLNGFTRFERDDLQQRLRAARQDLRVADNGSYDRYDRYSWDDGRRDNRYPSSYAGRGGPYEDVVVCERRGGVIGFLDEVTGNRDCFTVGQRVTFDLDPVPYAYRSRYRDGGNVYYRSDGRSIYEIDARTNTVLDVHRIPR